MGATMLLSATTNSVGVNVRLVGYGLSISRYQGIYSHTYATSIYPDCQQHSWAISCQI
jgi:hypothetical protein